MRYVAQASQVHASHNVAYSSHSCALVLGVIPSFSPAVARHSPLPPPSLSAEARPSSLPPPPLPHLVVLPPPPEDDEDRESDEMRLLTPPSTPPSHLANYNHQALAAYGYAPSPYYTKTAFSATERRGRTLQGRGRPPLRGIGPAVYDDEDDDEEEEEVPPLRTLEVALIKSKKEWEDTINNLPPEPRNLSVDFSYQKGYSFFLFYFDCLTLLNEASYH